MWRDDARFDIDFYCIHKNAVMTRRRLNRSFLAEIVYMYVCIYKTCHGMGVDVSLRRIARESIGALEIVPPRDRSGNEATIRSVL